MLYNDVCELTVPSFQPAAGSLIKRAGWNRRNKHVNWPDFPPQQTNRGSTPAPEEVVGRQEFIKRLWHTLERQSVLLTAQRRLGKSSILIVMESAPADGVLVFKRDIEDVRTSIEFVEHILDDIRRYLSVQGRVGEWFGALAKTLGGLEIGGKIKLPAGQSQHWKTHLEKVISDLTSHDERLIIFLWDEMPLMLDNIRQQSGEQAAMEMLDTLRALRQRHPRLRMVFTGSVGLHHVLGALRRAGHGNAPTNDMLFRDLPALARADAMGLAWSLLRGENLAVEQPETVIPLIADLMDCLPFYIHHVVGWLVDDGHAVTPQIVQEAVEALLLDAQDPCGFRNYQVRIKRHYLPEHQPLAFALLDLLAVVDRPLPFDELANQVRHRLAVEDEEVIREALYLLESDHYIALSRNGEYVFRFPIIARAWRMQRSLRP
jgi:hypothetical protein